MTPGFQRPSLVTFAFQTRAVFPVTIAAGRRLGPPARAETDMAEAA